MTRAVRGTNADRLGSRGKTVCGRCGRELSREKRKQPPYCKDCRGTDPQFCN